MKYALCIFLISFSCFCSPGNASTELNFINQESPATGKIETTWQVNYNENKVREVFDFLKNKHDLPADNDRFVEINLAFEKIRKSIQSHVGLSKRQRDNEESFKEVLIKNDISDDWNQNTIYWLPNDSGADPKLKNVYIKLIESNHSASKPGVSFMFKTKFRTFVLKISKSGQVMSSLDLNWYEINKDVETDFISLRAFTSWEWHSQSNFFNTRSTNTALGILSDIFDFSYDKHKYFHDAQDIINISKSNLNNLLSLQPNIYLTINKDIIEPNSAYLLNTENSAFALVEISKPILGKIRGIFPVIYDGNTTHILINGHKESTKVIEVFTVDYQSARLIPWGWKRGVKHLTIKNPNPPDTSFKIKNFRTLETGKNKHLIKHITAAPMIRGSDLPTRIYWLSSLGRFAIYSEMTTVAGLLNVKRDSSPLNSLKNSLYSEQAIQSIERIMISEYELKNAREIIFQVAIPHPLGKEDHDFFWGENGENIARTTKITCEIIAKLTTGYTEKVKLGINMCCPAPAMENSSSGFGLINNRNYIYNILENSDLPIEVKMLMLSEDGNSHPEISIDINRNFTKFLINRENKPRIIYQAKSRNDENYKFEIIPEVIAPYADKNMKFSYSGMVATLTEESLKSIGLTDGKPHYSAEYILNTLSAVGHDNVEVLLGRVLLGSSFLLEGKYISDKEILLNSLLHLPLLIDMFDGMGLYGLERIKIQVLYHVRHLRDDQQKVSNLMTDIFNATDIVSIKNLLLIHYNEVSSRNFVGSISLEREVFKFFPELITKDAA